ncbi:MAG: hypothetical protein JXA30_18945 [Deltaproteobacteria bacterium]|nr:hypothetical protein [Deltaproteobacteria bacterium]
MITGLRLCVLAMVILSGCEASKNQATYGNIGNGDSSASAAAGDQVGGAGGTVAIPDTGMVDTGSMNSPDLTAPIDSGMSDGISISIDSGYSDGGQSVVRDTGVTSPDSSSTTQDTGAGGDPYEEVRQVCVDTINEYRATLGLAPLTRASATLEECSDVGAKKDGDSRQAHSSAGDCPPLGSQNTCPGYPVGGWSGSATLADSLKRCLQQMWAEGEPPEGRAECISKYYRGDTTCFMTYGHYLNMSDPNNGTVACGFYDMGSNTFWMNQNFGR